MNDNSDIVDECPICGGDRGKNIDETKRKLYAFGVASAMRNPGGVGILMNDGRKLHLIGECNACDEKVIRRFLGND